MFQWIHFHFPLDSMEFILFSLRLIGARNVNSPPQLGISCFYKHLYRFLSVRIFHFYNTNSFLLAGKIIIVLHVQIESLFETWIHNSIQQGKKHVNKIKYSTVNKENVKKNRKLMRLPRLLYTRLIDIF